MLSYVRVLTNEIIHQQLFIDILILILIYLLTAIGLSTGGRSTVHIYKQKIHRTIQNKQYIE